MHSHPPSSHPPAAAAAAADYVVGLHQAPGLPGSWFILQNCSGTIHGGQVVGLLGPSGACARGARDGQPACHAPASVLARRGTARLRRLAPACRPRGPINHIQPPARPPAPAGCGKTTLLSMIAGSASDLGASAMVAGLVEVDGHRRRRSHVAYVPQSDVLIPSLTVAECLRYSALLRLPPDTPPLDLQARGAGGAGGRWCLGCTPSPPPPLTLLGWQRLARSARACSLCSDLLPSHRWPSTGGHRARAG